MRGKLIGGLLLLAGILARPVGLRADEAAALACVAKFRGKIARDLTRDDRPVVTVDLYGLGRDAKVTDADVKELSAFKNLRSLQMRFMACSADSSLRRPGGAATNRKGSAGRG